MGAGRPLPGAQAAQAHFTVECIDLARELPAAFVDADGVQSRLFAARFALRVVRVPCSLARSMLSCAFHALSRVPCPLARSMAAWHVTRSVRPVRPIGAALGVAALPPGATLGSHSRQRGAARWRTVPRSFRAASGALHVVPCGVGVVHLLGATMPHRALYFQALPLIVLSASRRCHFPGATPLPSMSGPSPFPPCDTRGRRTTAACNSGANGNDDFTLSATKPEQRRSVRRRSAARSSSKCHCANENAECGSHARAFGICTPVVGVYASYPKHSRISCTAKQSHAPRNIQRKNITPAAMGGARGSPHLTGEWVSACSPRGRTCDCTDWAAQLRRMQAHVERTRRADADADADALSADPSLPAGGAAQPAQPMGAKDGLATVAAGSDETDADALD